MTKQKGFLHTSVQAKQSHWTEYQGLYQYLLSAYGSGRKCWFDTPGVCAGTRPIMRVGKHALVVRQIHLNGLELVDRRFSADFPASPGSAAKLLLVITLEIRIWKSQWANRESHPASEQPGLSSPDTKVRPSE